MSGQESAPSSVEKILEMMAEMLGEEPTPMMEMSKLIPEWIPRQASDRKFVFDLRTIPEKYKHLIMVAASTAVGCPLCTETFMKLASKAGASKEEIGETLLATRFALASTVFATALEGMRYLNSAA